MPGSPRLAAATAAALLSPLLLPAAAPAQVTMERVMDPAYQPRLAGGPGVNIETPPREQWDRCKVEPVTGNTTGYVVVGPQGQTLRRLLDANGDGSINLFQYYDQGLEVYREWDADGAEGGNQNNNFRWVNLGGTRWGVDTDGDLKIDEWKRISAQEAGRVAAEALLENDPEGPRHRVGDGGGPAGDRRRGADRGRDRRPRSATPPRGWRRPARAPRCSPAAAGSSRSTPASRA